MKKKTKKIKVFYPELIGTIYGCDVYVRNVKEYNQKQFQSVIDSVIKKLS